MKEINFSRSKYFFKKKHYFDQTICSVQLARFSVSGNENSPSS